MDETPPDNGLNVIQEAGGDPADAATVKRPPGRPRKDGLPPGSAPPATADVIRYPRDTGAATGGKAKAGSVYAKSIVLASQAAALRTGIPEFEVSEAEGALLGEAWSEFYKHFKPKLTPKQEAALGLFTVAMTIAGPHAFDAVSRITIERKRGNG